MFQAATPTRHRQKVLQVTSMAHGWSPDGTRVVSAARSGHFGCGLFMKSWNDINIIRISLGYHCGWIWGYDGYDFPAWTVLFASFRKRDPAPSSAPSQERHPQLQYGSTACVLQAWKDQQRAKPLLVPQSLGSWTSNKVRKVRDSSHEYQLPGQTFAFCYVHISMRFNRLRALQ